jgi:hypothetical protein
MAERTDNYGTGNRSQGPAQGPAGAADAANQQVVTTLLAILQDVQQRTGSQPPPRPVVSERDFAFGTAVFDILQSSLSLGASPVAATAVSPASGPAAGGTAVTITGRGFVLPAAVTFGGRPSSSVSVVSATEVRAVTPAGDPGSVDVVLTTFGGTSRLPGAFTYSKS